LLGEVPRGLPIPAVPEVSWDEVTELLPLALACFLLGAVISLVLLIRRASAPHVAFLGRIPGTQRYSDLSRHQTNEPISGVLAFRVEAGIVYFNVDHIADTVLARFHAMIPPPKLVICDLSTSPNLDMAGAHLFLRLESELKKLGAIFRVVEARSKVRDILRLEGFEERTGRIDRFTTLAEAIDNFQVAANGETETDLRAGKPKSART
jgi:MFS superfamily sulfate permease-like transporter